MIVAELICELKGHLSTLESGADVIMLGRDQAAVTLYAAIRHLEKEANSAGDVGIAAVEIISERVLRWWQAYNP